MHNAQGICDAAVILLLALPNLLTASFAGQPSGTLKLRCHD
jgi:hypothetical protein